MLLPMNHQFYPYQQQVVPFFQRGKGDITVFGGTHPYGQGGNGLEGKPHPFSRPRPRKWENGYSIQDRIQACKLHKMSSRISL